MSDQSIRQISYDLFVARLAKPPADILLTLSLEKIDAIHAVLGIVGEAGELVDAIKKWAVYNKPLDRANAIEELGDLEFYMQMLRTQLRVSREEVLDVNKAKLSVRYAKGYSDKAAIDRADKA